MAAHQARSRGIVKRHNGQETVWEVACLNGVCRMFLSRRVASERGGECTSECRLAINETKYEVLCFDCGGYILLLLNMLLRNEYPSAVASTSQKVLNLIR